MSPVTPVLVSRHYANPPVAGEQIHSSLSGLYFTPKAANTLKDIFVNKMQSECWWGRICVHSRDQSRSHFAGLLKFVALRVQPHIDGDVPPDVDVIPVAAVVATERLVSIVAQRDGNYTHDQILAASGLLTYAKGAKPAWHIKAGDAFLIAACSYFASLRAEFADPFEPPQYPREPMTVGEFWRDLMTP